MLCSIVAQSLANVLVHLIFSTKNREPLLVNKDLRQKAHATVLRDKQCPTLIVGGVADHVHILCQLGKTQSISGVMELRRTFSACPLGGRFLGLRKATP
jgi:REP element-mobilizing transposase RayT